MKELSIEEKAKAYDNAVINGSRLWECGAITRENYEYIFPKLKESEDEKIRKTLIEYIKGHLNETGNISRAEAIAWLEKQGESYTKRDVDDAFVEGMVYAKSELEKQGEKDRFIKEEIKCIEGYRENAIKKLEELEKQCEQKPVDKIKSKFKVGDWVVCEVTGSVYQIKNCIENLSNHRYGYDLTNGGYIGSDEVNHYRLWTIQDAKDGDVLYFNNDISGFHSIGLFKRLASKNEINGGTYRCYTRYSGFNEENRLEIAQNNDELCHFGTEACPATKEQRDQLEKAMADAGYEWNAEKKELKKINKNTDVGHEFFSDLLEKYDCDNIDDYAYQCAYCMSHDWLKDIPTWDDVERACKLGAEWNEKHHKSSWSEEDERICRNIVNDIANDKSMCKYEISKGICDEQINWLKSLKDRVQPKQEWSVEDKLMLMSCIEIMQTVDSTEEQQNWLKSLRPQNHWKPSEEQMKAFEHFIRSIGESGYASPYENNTKLLYSLLNDLKKLKA